MNSNNLRRWVLFGLAALLLAAPLAAAPRPVSAQAEAGMPSFRSDEELRRFLQPKGKGSEMDIATPPPPPPPPPPPMMAPPPPPGSPAPPPAAPSMANDKITSTQVADVDEGGIVKVAGDNLIVLRRGRLFSISIAGGSLKPVDSINAFPPGVTGQGDWYDEMLIKGDMVVVVGYSYARGGTEVNRFRVAPDGKLSFLDAYHLRTSDYYSSSNYASRLIGNQLVVYAPQSLWGWGGEDDDILANLPGFDVWTKDSTKPVFRRMLDARQIYLPAPMKAHGPKAISHIHTVSRCDVTAPVMACQASAVLGGYGRTFFVSQNAVYVWLNAAYDWNDRTGKEREIEPAYLYRIPLNGGRPAAAQVRGAPINQFSFNANGAAGMIEVLLTPSGNGDAMWNPEFATGRAALLRLPTGRFGDGSRAPMKTDYRLLPGGPNYGISQNRFVGDHVLYGINGGTPNPYSLVVAPTAGGEPSVFPMGSTVERIEQVGRDGLVVTSTNETTFTTVDLTPGRQPSLGDRFIQPDSRQAESRSQAFFFNPTTPDGQGGLLGLPILRLDRDQWLADMLFLRRSNQQLTDFGRLQSSRPRGQDDGCTASCVDWYGNARPIFMRGRVFALLGYELVEGDASGAKIREVRRVDYAPKTAPR